MTNFCLVGIVLRWWTEWMDMNNLKIIHKRTWKKWKKCCMFMILNEKFGKQAKSGYLEVNNVMIINVYLV